MKNFDRERWVRLDNMLKQYEIRRHNDDVSMLYIFAEKQLSHLVRVQGGLQGDIST